MESQNYSSKKQRNQKNQRDRRRTQDKDNEVVNRVKQEETNNPSAPAPQPQRANRRQRNEPSAVPPSAVPTSSQPSSQTVVPDKKENTKEQNSVTVDFSNLKRETEDIAKLTKKFAKREISSNWHRYSAPEGQRDVEAKEDDGPADFTDLLNVSLAGGGHLQLKEEDWWTATGSELGGYFALNLQVLSKGLDCIPVYEQLGLPKHIITNEGLTRLDALAEEAKAKYNSILSEEEKKSNAKEVIKIKSSLIVNETMKPKLVVVEDEINETFNILDVECATDTLNNLKLENGNCKDTVNKINTSSKTSSSYKSLDINQDIALNVENLNTNTSFNANSINLLTNNESESLPIDLNKDFKENHSEKFVNIETVINNNYRSNTKLTEEKERTPENDINMSDTSLNIEISLNDKDNLPNNVHSEKKKLSGSRGKQANKERKSPGRELSVEKVPPESKNIKAALEEDDDLDFLLSLKKPVEKEPKNDFKPTPIKESTYIPGSVNDSKQTEQKTSELDDWLDSVLED